MKQFLKALPIPAAGVMLGLAALGNLLQSYSEGVRLVFGALALVLWVCLVLKAVFCWKGVCQAMEDPIAASVAGTFPMATMLLAVYAKPFAGAAAAQIIWLLGIALHVVLIVWFTVKFFGKFQLGRVFASYYIVYVGIVVASLTAPAFDMAGTVGTCAFWFGFVCLIALLALVTVRYVKLPVQKDPAKPIFCIYAAPVSLCLAGYIQSVSPKLPAMIIAMLMVSTALYIVVLVRLPEFLKLPFYPSYAAFTFPMVITAIAAKQSMACLTGMGYAVGWLSPLVLAETVIAAVMVVYALIRYVMAVAKACKAA
ncbi:MAG: TDT family transporter [Oscillospiraceae bacterium]|nr:TDT family transporter [Oscillospiraceae bacterium]